MSESKHNKGTSVAAFLFMPQFHLCFRGFSHIVPIFMRTLALMFTQAGLIDRNHPASRYGIEGVKKYSFAELMGEAWYSLRRQNGNAQQWGLFISVIMMIAVLFAAMLTFVLNVFLGIGTAAQAQIFSHPGSPYGAAGQTDIPTMQGAITGAAPMFDKRTAYQETGASGSLDFGLMLLDKVLRQSTVGNGGATQNALAGLMQVYNTGVLVVAAVMIFWMILSIVVDTAKTGIVGGGRHNMVWTPIRVVFALGIMIPLGTTGFSSGQFAVMKLAEWGNNFGTRAWVGYVTGVIDANSLLSPFSPGSAGQLAQGLARIKTCQVAWNAEAAKQANLDPLYRVAAGAPKGNLATGTVTIAYTNSTSSNLCGTIEYAGRLGALDPNAWADAIAATHPAMGALGGGLSQAASQFKIAMQQALTADLADSNGTGGNGALIEQARQFACGYVGRHMQPNDGSANPVLASGQCGSATGCGSNPTSSFPDASCHQAMVDIARGRIGTAHSGAVANLTNYIGGPMITDMTQKGWAAMGSWPHYISVLNQLSQSVREVNLTIVPGTMWAEPTSELPLEQLSTIEDVVRRINADYSRWWTEKVSDPATTTQVAAVANREGSMVNDTTVNKDDLKDSIKTATSSSAFGDSIMRRIMPDSAGFLAYDLVEAENDATYPFAQLVTTGGQIVALFMGIILALTIVQALSSSSGMGFSAGAGFAVSALVNGISSIAGMGVAAGMVLMFYVPLLPLIRTTFAALTWIISVFEAVAMVPMAALNFLTSVGEGMGARENWILWLNVLMRPVLVVIGFVGAMLIFNSFVVYFQTNFTQGIAALRSDMNWVTRFLSWFAYTAIYVFAVYTAANSSFKLLDLIPDAMMRWMGGRADVSFDDNSSVGALAAGQMVGGFRGTQGAFVKAPGPVNPTASNATQPSDIRLKTDIRQVGSTVHALPLYQFRYIDKDGVYEGVMAQDVLKVMPEAVITGKDGFYRVDYGMLGTAMRRIH